MALDALHNLINRLSLAPGLRQVRQRRFDMHFNHNKGMNLFRGLYDTFEQATEAIPVQHRAGYDSDEASELYTEWLDIFDYDYPAMFWIQQAVLEGKREIFDLGGNIGIKYYAYSKHCAFPSDLSWTVSDVPAVVRKGREFARRRATESRLRFADSIKQMATCDVLFASGSLQYLPQRLPELLSEVGANPSWIIINITPLHPLKSYFTVNSFGPGFCAYRVDKRDALVGDIRALGYTLHAEWKNAGKALDLPFHPGYGLDHYTGLCLRRESGGQRS